MDPIDDQVPTRAPGGREFGWVALITGLLGLWASASLAIDYINRLVFGQDYVAACDINPMIGCGLFLDSDAASAFAIPNVVVGVAAFPVVITLAMLLLSRVELPRWIWRGAVVGGLFGIGFVTWLQYQALFVLSGLCPYCLVIWAVMIPLFVHIVARAGEAGALGFSAGVARQLVRNRWIIVVLWYLVVAAAILLVLGEALLAVM
nr:vitamin K epoxide reductase family protein [Pseudactinotalea sp. HY160]